MVIPRSACWTQAPAEFRGGRVVVIGGGIIGASVAFHLACRGHRDVTIVERDLVGEGATARAAGGIRTQFSSEINVRLSLGSIPFWESFEDRTESPLTFRRHGYLFVHSDPQQLNNFAQMVGWQREMGVDVQLLDPDETAAVFPGMRVDDVSGSTYTPPDGSASPTDALAGLVRKARLEGVRVEQHTVFLGLLRDEDGAVRGVRTSAGDLEAELVLIAAGPQAAPVGEMCGIRLPVVPTSRQAFSVSGIPLDPGLPLTIDMATGSYIHPGFGGGAVIGGNDREVASSQKATVDWDRAEGLVSSVLHRFPHLSDMSLAGGWAGLREMTPDDLAIVGPVQTIPGLWVAAGFSGHGFMQAPMVGQQMAEWWLDGAPTLDLSSLSLNRFDSTASFIGAETAVF